MTLFVIGIVVGIIIGVIVCLLLTPKKSGNLIVDRSDPDGPFMFLELTTDPKKLKGGRLTMMKVVDKDYFGS